MEASPGDRGRQRAVATSERKPGERRSRSLRRKSAPEDDVIETVRRGQQGRRRMSDTHRRKSKSKAAARRRERSELRPPLPGHPGIGRASLPSRLPAPMMSARAEPAEQPAVAAVVRLPEATAEDVGKTDLVQPMDEDDKEHDGARWTPEMVAEAARGILGDDTLLQLRFVRWLRVVLSLSKTPPAAEVVGAGLVPRLLEFLRSTESPELRPEALCALTNIASTEFTRAVALESDAIPTLKGLLGNPDIYLREQSAWCLGNIAGDCVEMRDMVLNAGVMEPLLVSLSASQQGSTSFTRTGTWALNNLCRGLPPPSLSVIVPVLGIIGPIVAAASRGDDGALVDAGWVLYHVTRGGSDRIDAVLSAGLVAGMPDLLLHENRQVVRPVLRAMDNLACSSGAHREALIEAGVLDPVVEVLGHDNTKVRADALRLLSCMAAGSPDQVTAVASTEDIIPSVMAELEEGNALCRREAAWVFLNICECGLETHETVIPEMVSHGVLSAVCHNLDKEADVESLVVMLSLLFAILDGGGGGDGSMLSDYVTTVEESDGFHRVTSLMNDHDDMEVYDKATDIIRCFAPEEDEEEDPEKIALRALARADRNERSGPNSESDSDSDDMSDDSLSDDSFHPELGSTAGPITPPQQSKPFQDSTAPPPPSHAASSAKGGGLFGGEPTTAEGFGVGAATGRGAGFGTSPPRQPLGAVTDHSSRVNNAVGGGIWDPQPEAAGAGAGESMVVEKSAFREGETDRTE